MKRKKSYTLSKGVKGCGLEEATQMLEEDCACCYKRDDNSGKALLQRGEGCNVHEIVRTLRRGIVHAHVELQRNVNVIEISHVKQGSVVLIMGHTVITLDTLWVSLLFNVIQTTIMLNCILRVADTTVECMR